MKLIKLLSILVFSLLCIPFSHAMEAPAAESEQSTQLQLTDLPIEKLLEIIEHGIDQAQTLKEAWEFIQNLALTNRQFAALTRSTAVVNALAQKVKNPQQELFDLTKGKIGDIAAQMVITALINAGAVVNKQGHRGWTALIYASVRGHKAVVRELLQAGADIDKQDNNGKTALMWASVRGHEALVRKLLRVGADINKQDNYGHTALMWVSEKGHKAVVRELLQAGADINKTILGQTALDLAKTPAIKRLIQQAMEKQAQSNNNNE